VLGRGYHAGHGRSDDQDLGLSEEEGLSRPETGAGAIAAPVAAGPAAETEQRQSGG
jgi:hypothetical protein